MLGLTHCSGLPVHRSSRRGYSSLFHSPELTKAYHRDWLLIPIEGWSAISGIVRRRGSAMSEFVPRNIHARTRERRDPSALTSA